MHYMVAMVTGFLEKYDEMILRRSIYYCGKFQTDTINQTVFGKAFVKLVWGKLKLFRATLSPEMTSHSFPVSCFWSRDFVPPRSEISRYIGTPKQGEGKSLSDFFAILISTMGRFNRANKKICHIHFKL